MLEDNRLVTTLLTFFRGRGQFKERNSYIGMEISSVNGLFVEYFKSLNSFEQKQLAFLIVAGSVGQQKELQRYLDDCISLLLTFCIAGYTEFFESYNDILEKEFNNPQNLEVWIRAEDQDFLPRGLKYKKVWNYALALSSSLFYLNSKKIGDSYNYLVEKARSAHFREALIRNRKEIGKKTK